jgi:DNA polymerase III epsilon subunit-like protein
MNILYIDTETTGIDPQNNSIIELAAILEVEGKIVDTFQETLAPKVNGNISLEALKVNKNSITKVLAFEDRQQKVLKFIDWLLRFNLSGPLYICGHNVAFDIAFIKETLKEFNISGWDSAVSYRLIDTSTIGTFLINSGVINLSDGMPKGSSLEKLALALNIEVRGRKLHSAMGDVELTREVYQALLNKVKV